jgi:hypothetical protein
LSPWGQWAKCFSQAVGNRRRNRRVERVVPQHLVRGIELACGGLGGRGRLGLLLCFGSEFGLAFHSTISSKRFHWVTQVPGTSGVRLFKQDGEGLASAMEFAPNGIRSLLRKSTDLLVA